MSSENDGGEDQNDVVSCYYDSLDRILSSSSAASSCSSSPSDEDPNPGSDPDCDPVPRFPMGISGDYDVWAAPPCSVEERRARLLRQMGLSKDPALTRQNRRVAPAAAVLNKSVSSVQFSNAQVSGNYLLRSVSDVFDCCSSGYGCDASNSSRLASCNGGNVVPVKVVNERESVCDNVNNDVGKCVSENRGAILRNEDTVGKDVRVVEEDSVLNCDVTEVVERDSECRRSGADSEYDPVCTIRNLDNGKEFVVNEVGEDGTLEKVKEVDTGRHLTMEEFEMCVGHSPIVQELMRRQIVEGAGRDSVELNESGNGGSGSGGLKLKKKGSWLKSFKNVASSVKGHKDRRSSDERDTSSEKGGRRSSSATDDSQDVSFHGPERVRVRHYGKSCKELSALYKSQEIKAHNGAIWTVKFSLDGKYLASAGEDRVIHVWQVMSSDRKGEIFWDKQEDGNMNLLLVANGSPEPTLLSPNLDSLPKKKGRLSLSRKSVSLDHVVVPETMFSLTEKPFCSFVGHLDDVLDLSWSKSQHLLSSSMDKTVRLWQLSSKSCLKIFSHSDYVTSIQFNPVDDQYFISGSLDAKVRIWSIPDRQVVDWADLHEMVTAACYTPDGQAALVGSYKGSCRLYNVDENKLQQKSQINLQNKKKKSHHKKITGFQFAPGSKTEVLITSADSRIWVVDGVDLVHKFKGFRNTNSQISASLAANGKYVVCASEDSHVYVWKREDDSWPSRTKTVTVTQSYEHFHCQDVSAAIPWPGISDTSWGFPDSCFSGEQGGLLGVEHPDEVTANHPPTPEESNGRDSSTTVASGYPSSPFRGIISSATNSYFFDRISATWPEEKLLTSADKNPSPRACVDSTNGVDSSKSAWGMVIVTAGLRGEIRVFQNFGLPIRI